MSIIEIVGLMSGTSLDGLDIAHVRFVKKENSWTFEMLNSDNDSYSEELKKQLQTAPGLSKVELAVLNMKLGVEFGKRVNRFFKEKKIDKDKIQYIASHGHTVLHQPQNGFSLQIGCGATIAKETGVNVVNDFRNKDIAVGGQGAPLVPIGDKLLFSDKAEAFLNLGGFCNITFQNKNREWVAFDISPCNLPLNKLAELKGKEFDKDGLIARSGNIDDSLFNQLNALPFYAKPPPKSLGTEWLEEAFYPFVDLKNSVDDNMHTIAEHIAFQIAAVFTQHGLKEIFTTGGGVFNEYLISRIEFHAGFRLQIPSKEIIEYKEALIFAFLGALFYNKEPSNVPSATGAKEEVSLGVLHLA